LVFSGLTQCKKKSLLELQFSRTLDNTTKIKEVLMGRYIFTELDVPVTERDSNRVLSECKVIWKDNVLSGNRLVGPIILAATVGVKTHC
jgi:hypothetical protein